MKEYEIKSLLKEKKRLNKICKSKGFRFNIIKEYDNVVLLVIKRLDNQTPSTIRLRIEISNNERDCFEDRFVTIYNLKGNIICGSLIKDIPIFIYNFLNYDNIKIEYSFLGGKYDRQLMSKQQFEQTFNISIKDNDLSFPKTSNFPLTLENYYMKPFINMTFGKLVFEYMYIECSSEV